MVENRAPQEPPLFDPFEVWRQFYEANEQAWTQSIKEMTTTPDYVEAQGKMLETFLAYQKIIRDAMTTQLNFFNLPTRDDISRLGELLVGVEEKVDRLDETVIKLEESIRDIGQQMRSTEAPIVGIEQKVAGLDQTIGKMDKLVRDLGRQVSGLERPIDGVGGRIDELGSAVGRIDEAVLGLSQQIARLERRRAGQESSQEPSEPTPDADQPAPERPRRAAAGRASRQTAVPGANQG